MILITNDDGIVAPGIKALIEVASSFGEVIVVAPDAPQSGQGHAITITKPVKLRKVDLYKGITAYECSGTPVDCVKLAKNVLLKDKNIDLCVSGINHGSNASINILYSGTMSAAMEASLEGIDSIGFSLLDYSFEADFSQAKKVADNIIRAVLEKKLDGCKLLNVNIPNSKIIEGIKVCRQAQGRWIEEYQEGIDPRGEKYYWLTGKFQLEDEGKDSDVYALHQNFVSVVPSGYDLTAYTAVDRLKHLETNF
ncbi:MAG: 5'/3'-nucleotidase SurE [Saprospiraceae bacterium]